MCGFSRMLFKVLKNLLLLKLGKINEFFFILIKFVLFFLWEMFSFLFVVWFKDLCCEVIKNVLVFDISECVFGVSLFDVEVKNVELLVFIVFFIGVVWMVCCFLIVVCLWMYWG